MSSISHLVRVFKQVCYNLSLCTINGALRYKTVVDQCKKPFHWITLNNNEGAKETNFYSTASEYELMKFSSVKRVYF